jgi:hypothetical protein
LAKRAATVRARPSDPVRPADARPARNAEVVPERVEVRGVRKPPGHADHRDRGGPRFSLVDGLVTADKVLGVHTACGRTLKDVLQRHRALRGYHQH